MLHRLEKALAAFFRRATAGEQPGYPRFWSEDRQDSFISPQMGEHDGAVLDGGVLSLSQIGSIPIRLHRPWQSAPKTVTIRREAEGWYAGISCTAVPTQALPLSGRDDFARKQRQDNSGVSRAFDDDWVDAQVLACGLLLPLGAGCVVLFATDGDVFHPRRHGEWRGFVHATVASAH